MADPSAASAATFASDLKDWIGVAGFAISFFLGGLKVMEYRKGRQDRSHDQQAKVDDAWFKIIVLDNAIPTINAFLDAQRTALKKAANPSPGVARPYAAALQSYLLESEDLKARLRPIEELSTNTYETIIRAIDTLDDAVSPFCPHADDASYDRQRLAQEWIELQRQFDRCRRECLSLLRKVHFALHKGQDPNKAIPPPGS